MPFVKWRKGWVVMDMRSCLNVCGLLIATCTQLGGERPEHAERAEAMLSMEDAAFDEALEMTPPRQMRVTRLAARLEREARGGLDGDGMGEVSTPARPLVLYLLCFSAASWTRSCSCSIRR